MTVKVNLGCGPVGKEDWVNIDWGILAFLHRYRLVEKILLSLKFFPHGYNVRWPKNLRLHNCKKRLLFRDNSVDYIYTSHFLEHFKKFEAEKIIADCCRVLRNGGVIRIAVPDLETLAKKYLAKDTEYFKELYKLMNFGEDMNYITQDFLLADSFIDNFYPSFYRKQPRGINKLLVSFIRPHYWMYDYASLEFLLKSCGLVKIQRKSFRDGRVPDLNCLDVFPEASLYIEAEK